MKNSAFWCTCIAVLAPAAASLADDAIAVRISIADAEVTAETETRQTLVPHDLEYAIEIDIRCSNQGSPRSLSLGVADIRQHFELAEDTRQLTASFVVPGRQLAPLVTEGYCVVDDPESHSTILVEDAFTAQLSLRCEQGEESSSVTYLSKPLAVRFNCALPAQDSVSASSSDVDK